METVGEKKYHIVVVGSKELSLGAKLAGVVETHAPENMDEAEKELEADMKKDDVGILIVTSKIAKAIRNRKLKEELSISTMPLVVEIPDYDEQTTYEETLRTLIMRAIGIDVGANI